MMKRLIRFAGDDKGHAALDWLVLATGVLALGIAIIATTTSAGATTQEAAQVLFSARI